MSRGPQFDAGMTVALLAGAAGVVTGNATILLSSVVGFAYTAYRLGTSAPTLAVELDREVSERSPRPSEKVTVTLTVRNVGESAIPDLRIVDGVPERLAVVDGSPRHGTSLGADEEISFSYTIRTRRGAHEFEPTTLVAQSISGTEEKREKRTVETTITCDTFVEDVPLRAQTTASPGHITTDASGEGLEFHSTREYQPADPMSRIDWKRFARTQELTTVNFRESRSASVLLLVDARSEASIARRSGEPDAIDLSVYAAKRIATSLVRENNRVGVSVYGKQQMYLSPSGGREQAVRVRSELEDVPTPSSVPSGSGLFSAKRKQEMARRKLQKIRKRLGSETQVVFLSPMADDEAVDAAKRLDAYGHAVTVVCPDVTATETPGGSVAHLARRERLSEVRKGGLRVVDWSPDDPLAAAISKSQARWSA
ncbi:DUF58 domain-containing protein [Haladaptatus cibarius]|uniref:DUF58 domain-containing protein n=1 Tax=Haladaptatus cibarius TaxID=453847 RepID=UPI000679334C|nr:DUF58 domain-containing protein [Haladaptatus cibarius]